MTSKTTSKNILQGAKGQVRSGRVTNAATGLYVVPADTRTTVESLTMNLDAVGGDATYAVALRNAAGTFFPLGAHVAVNAISEYAGPITIEVNDRVSNIGDAGSTNGTCDQACNVQEFPV